MFILKEVMLGKRYCFPKVLSPENYKDYMQTLLSLLKK